MLETMVGFFVSGFANPSILGIGLAIVFGAIWFAPYWTPILKKPWAWAVLGGSAILSWAAVSFIQIPLQVWTGQALNNFWSQEVLLKWLLLAGIPQILLSGLVQEGSKLVPIVVYWWRKGRNIDPKLGLAIGAVAGAGFGVFEAQWAHNQIFASGWSWQAVQSSGLIALAGFWERFFAVAFHIAVSALAGWGLARGWGWQFYLLAAFLHASLNYSVVPLRLGLITVIQVEIFAAVWAALVTGVALWLRWRKSEVVEESVSEGEQPQS
jgi:RsiW-degrading membrane proteinase PrsW (M82 family)